MRKSLLTLILTGLFSSSSIALDVSNNGTATQSSNLDIDGMISRNKNPSGEELNNKKEKKEPKLGRLLIKRAIQYKAIKTVVKNPGKTLIAGAAVAGVGYYGYYKLSKEAFKQKMARYEFFEQEWQNIIDYYPDEWGLYLKE